MVITEKAIDDTPQKMLITMLCTVLQIIGSVILPGASLLARIVFDAAPMSWVEKVVALKKKPGDLTSGKWRLFQTILFW